MNHIFRVIFNSHTGVFQAVSEQTRSHCKIKKRQKRLKTPRKDVLFQTPLSVLAAALWFLASPAMAITIGTDEIITSTATQYEGLTENIDFTGGKYTVTITDNGEVSTSGTENNPTISIGTGNNTDVSVNVNGGGKINASNKLFVGRQGGSGTLTIGDGGTVTATDGGSIGAVDGQGGTVIIEKGGVLNSGGWFLIGGDSQGSMTVESGGHVKTLGAGHTGGNAVWGIGENENGNGTLNVSGTIDFDNNTDFHVGYGGQGNVIINSGGKIENASSLSVGTVEKGYGKIINEGLLTIKGSATVGMHGQAEVEITHAGEMIVDGGLSVGAGDGSGTVTLTGNSTLTAKATNIGSGSGSGKLLLAGDSAATLGHTIIGSGGGSGTVTISDNSTLTSTGYIRVGTGSGRGELNVEGGTLIGSNAGSFQIGLNESGRGIVNVSKGGSLELKNSEVTVGNSGNGTLNVDGAGSTFSTNTANNFIVGHVDKGLVSVTNGGQILLQGNQGAVIIGRNGGTGLLVVDGNGSTFRSNSSGEMAIGNAADSTGTVTLKNGGELALQENAKINVGSDSGIGVLNIGEGSASGAGIIKNNNNIELGAKGTLNFAHNTAGHQFGSEIAGSGLLLHSGTGTTILTHDSNSFAGQVDITAGKLQLGGNAAGGGIQGSIGSASVDIGAGATLAVYRNNEITLSGAISGDGTLQQSGSGTTILTDNNDDFTGQVDVVAGVLQLGANVDGGGTSGGVNGSSINVANGAALAINRSNDVTLDGIVRGKGKLIQRGSGTTILTGINAYTGGTDVQAGTLQGDSLSLQGDISVSEGATLVFDQSNTRLTEKGNERSIYYGGILTGDGHLIKRGEYDLWFEKDAQIGQMSLEDGRLNIVSDAHLAVRGDMEMQGGTTLGVSITENPSVSVGGELTLAAGHGIGAEHDHKINIDGYHALTDEAVHTLVTTSGGINDNTHLGIQTFVAGRELGEVVSLENFMVGSAWLENNDRDIVTDARLVWLNNNRGATHGTFYLADGERFYLGVDLADNTYSATWQYGWNGRDLTKTGDGTLFLDGVNTYSGITDVQAGSLIIGSTAEHNGAQVAGDATVQNGALLGGYGQILGTATVNSGGVLAPGYGGTGTLTVGDAVFASGSTFLVQVNPDGSADRLVANSELGGSGRVTINRGANLELLGGAGNWSNEGAYLIVDTNGGVSGHFDKVTSNLAFLNHTVNYAQPDQVWLEWSRNETSFGDLDGSYNQSNIGKGVESLGNGNEIYDMIVGMDRDQALSAFDNLSGEIHASVKSALLTNRYARDAVNQHLSRGEFSYLNPETFSHGLWFSSWGHDGHLKNDGNAAKLDIDGWGFLFGHDAYDSQLTTVGMALGYERINVKAGDNRHSSADADVIHLMAYGRTNLNGLDLKGAVGYGWLNVDSGRKINVGTLSSYNRGSYNGGWMQAYLEGSHTFKVNQHVDITPYLNLAWQRLKTETFTESGEYGRLRSKGGNDHVLATTIGVRSGLQITDNWRVYGEAGWQHNEGDVTPEAKLNFIGGDSYRVRGTAIDRNTALIGVGTRYALTDHV